MQNAARPRQEHTLLWSGKKRLWFGAPWTFTTYYIYDNELVVKSGILNQRFDSTKMFRILDVTITRSLLQRIFGLSTLLIDSMDQSSDGAVVMKNIRDGEDVEQTLQDAIDSERMRNRVGTRELHGDMDEGMDDGGYDDGGMF